MNTDKPPSEEEIDLSQFVDVSEAAKMLKLSTDRIRQFCREGRIGQKVLGVWMIGKNELAVFATLDRPDGRRPGQF